MGQQCPIAAGETLERAIIDKESNRGEMLAAGAEKIDILEKNIRRRDRELELLRSKIDKQRQTIDRLQREKEELERRLKKDRQRLVLSQTDRDHHGDREYWTAERLHVLRRTSGLSYRELEQKTGIPKSTVQRLVTGYREASTG